MEQIERIIIKGSSGFFSDEEAYVDKITITPHSSSYEYKPLKESASNPTQKWSYKTENPTFAKIFDELADSVSRVLTWDDDLFATDVGETSFVIVHADKTREQRLFFLPAEEFAECFAIAKKLVPNFEPVPEVLKTNIDFD